MQEDDRNRVAGTGLGESDGKARARWYPPHRFILAVTAAPR